MVIPQGSGLLFFRLSCTFANFEEKHLNDVYFDHLQGDKSCV